jgi:hypothetical protein
MEIIVKNGNVTNWRGKNLTFISVELVDTNTVHVHFENHPSICFIAEEEGEKMTSINGVICNTVEEIVNELNK